MVTKKNIKQSKKEKKIAKTKKIAQEIIEQYGFRLSVSISIR